MGATEAERAVIEVGAVLFDMDGTLVDSTAVVESLWREFAAQHGLAADELLAFSHGRPCRDTVARFLPTATDRPGIVAAFERRELAVREGIDEIPGAVRLMRRLIGAPVAIVTSASRPLAEARLTAARIPVPQVLVTGDDVVVGKPDPSGYLLAARRLGVPPEDCAVFEDAEAGIAAGLAAGAHVVVVGAHRSTATGPLVRVPDLVGVDASVVGRRVRLRVADDPR